MKKKNIIWILVVINTLLILLYLFPISALYDTLGVLASHKERAVGIIGGADGPTAIFISSSISLYFIAIVILEVSFITYLFFSHFRK